VFAAGGQLAEDDLPVAVIRHEGVAEPGALAGETGLVMVRQPSKSAWVSARGADPAAKAVEASRTHKASGRNRRMADGGGWIAMP